MQQEPWSASPAELKWMAGELAAENARDAAQVAYDRWLLAQGDADTDDESDDDDDGAWDVDAAR